MAGRGVRKDNPGNSQELPNQKILKHNSAILMKYGIAA